MESDEVTDLPRDQPAERSAIWLTPEWVEGSQRILDSFFHWTKRELLPRTGSALEQSRELFFAPFVVVSHGIQTDPILNYGNQVALTLWEMDVSSFVRTPSRMTAEPVHRDERARLLERTTRDGYVDDYQGIRVSSTGRRFHIQQATVWNLLDRDGKHVGQAATFTEWRWIGNGG